MNNPLVEAWMKSFGYELNKDTDIYRRPDRYYGITLQQATFFYNESIKARIDEREHMKFIENDGAETHKPYVQYRFAKDGLLLDWDDRTKALQAQLIQDKEAE